MQKRRVRLGDVLDDYCPRERRLTNHAVVAMIEDEVKRTRCTTCDAEHEYKHAKVPSPRRKKPAAAAPPVVEPTEAQAGEPTETTETAILVVAEEPIEEAVVAPPVPEVETIDAVPEPAAVAVEEAVAASADDEWPVHRPLIRATLPRPEGQAPERKPPDFTIRQSGGRFEGQRNGNKSRGRHPRQGQERSPGQSRFGNSRQGSTHGSRQGSHPHAANQQRHGNRQAPSGQRGGRPGQGGQHKQGHGRGPKRGR
jgi:hypothetical protein